MYIIPDSQVTFDDELQHHGVLGMKWGVRRYQNKDGSLTSAGKKRHDKTDPRNVIKNKNPNDVSLEALLKKTEIRKERLMDRIDEIMDENPNVSIKEIIDDARFSDSLISWVKAKEEYAEQYSKRSGR